MELVNLPCNIEQIAYRQINTSCTWLQPAAVFSIHSSVGQTGLWLFKKHKSSLYASLRHWRARSCSVPEPVTVRSSLGDLAGRYVSSHRVLRAHLMLLFLPHFPERTIFRWPFPRLMRTNVPPSLPVYVRLSAFADDCGAKGPSALCQTAVGLPFSNFFFFLHDDVLQAVLLAAAAKHFSLASANAMPVAVNRCVMQNFLVCFLISQNVRRNQPTRTDAMKNRPN